MNKKLSLLLILMFISSVIFFRGNILFVDDIYLHFFDRGIHIIKNFCYGTWLMHLQNILMYCIPHFIDINIQEWALSFGVLFKSFIISLIILYYIKIIKLKIKDDKIIIPLALILYFLIFICAKYITIVDFIIYEGFFRFIIPALLMLMYFYYYLKYDKNDRNNLLKLTMFGVITASSSEIAAVITTCTTFLLFIFDKKKDNKKSILIVLSSLIIGTLFLFLTKGFSEHLLQKVDITTITITNIINSVPDFFKVYNTKLIINFKFYYIGIIILIILNLLRKKKLEIYLPIFLIVSINVFFISLIILGKTSYFGEYWIEHGDLYITTSYIYALSFMLLSSYISDLNNKYNIIISVILILISLYMIHPLYYSIKYLQNTISNERDYSYMRDKIRMYYAYKAQTSIIPPYSHLDSFWTLMKDYRIKIGETNNYSIMYSSYDSLENYYYTNVYGHSKTFNKNSYVFANSDKEAIEKFEENGGTLAEIYTGKYKFSNLSDENFVLNKS